MTKYEYKVITHLLYESELNQYGQRGWLLVSVLKNGGRSISYFFRRETNEVIPDLSDEEDEHE